MAIRKTAICLILTGAAWAQQFPVRHQHLRKYCEGTLTVDEKGITFEGREARELDLGLPGHPTINTHGPKYPYTVV